MKLYHATTQKKAKLYRQSGAIHSPAVSYTHLDVYKRQGLKSQGYEYTSIHGDHRLYRRSGQNDTCYGTHFDRRIVERMAAEGLILASAVDIERVQRCDA